MDYIICKTDYIQNRDLYIHKACIYIFNTEFKKEDQFKNPCKDNFQRVLCFSMGNDDKIIWKIYKGWFNEIWKLCFDKILYMCSFVFFSDLSCFNKLILIGL